MSNRKNALLSQLSDGQFHSGQSLAEGLGISRTAVWKHVQALQTFGIYISSTPGKGYCLSNPVELLDEQRLNKVLRTNSHIKQLNVFFEIDSTNGYLLNELSIGPIHGHVVLAEFQAAGRGRRGNKWLSPLASGLCLSIGWHFETSPASLMALSLASGVAVLRTLNKFAVKNIRLKWPNDIICNDSKLGGILLESRIEAAGTCDVVLGLGLNLKLPEKLLDGVAQPITDISQNCTVFPSRNEMAINIIEELIFMFQEYAEYGFTSFIDDWRKYDYLTGKQAYLNMADNNQLFGDVMGIDENGLLQMQVDGEIKKFTSGELSVRALV